MAYNVLFTPQASRQMRKLPEEAKKAAIDLIEKLALTPRPPYFCKKLVNMPGYRVTFLKNYRIVYDIKDDILEILILKVAHRREVYR